MVLKKILFSMYGIVPSSAGRIHISGQDDALVADEGEPMTRLRIQNQGSKEIVQLTDLMHSMTGEAITDNDVKDENPEKTSCDDVCPSSSAYYWNVVNDLVGPSGVTSIPYLFEYSFPQKDVDWITSRLEEMNKRFEGCVSFRPKKTGDTSYAYFERPTGGDETLCHAHIGTNLTGPAKVQLWQNCMSTTTIVREMFHLMGFDHTHQRRDAKDWVAPVWSNIRPQYREQFNICVDIPDWDYNCRSIMHYARDELAADDYTETLRPLDESKCPLMWRRDKFDYYGRSYEDHVPFDEFMIPSDLNMVKSIYCPHLVIQDG